MDLVFGRGREPQFESIEVVDDFLEGVEQGTVGLVHDDKVKEERRDVVLLFLKHFQHGVVGLDVDSSVEGETRISWFGIDRWLGEVFFVRSKGLRT